MINIRRKEYDFLGSELNYWLENNIITSEQSEKILSLYEIKEYSLRRILFIASAVLIALGGVSFVASKWHVLPKILRVCVLAGSYIFSLVVCSFAGFRTKTGKSFLMLASLILGSSIFLITRMYNIKLEPSEILEYWIIAEIITGIITRDDWQIYLLQILSLIYLNIINAVDIFALEFMNISRVSLIEFFSPLKAFILLAALWGVNFRVRGRAIFNVNILITLLLFASRMSLAFGGTVTLVILAIAGGVMSLAMNGEKYHDGQIIGLLMAGVFGMLLTWPEFWRGSFAAYAWILSILSAVIIVPLMLVNIYRGHHVTGIIFCVLLACRYFFDRLFGYMPKAWGFTLLGVIFLIIALFFGKIKNYIGSKTHSSQEEA